MKVQLNYGVLSFCPDLTDPSAVSIPLGIVGAGVAANKDRFWFFVLKNPPWHTPAIDNDPIAKSILSELPALLDKQVGEGAAKVETRNFSSWLHGQFRNTLHVSLVKKELFSTKAGNPHRDIMAHCMDLFTKSVFSGKKKAAMEAMPESAFRPLPEAREELVPV